MTKPKKPAEQLPLLSPEMAAACSRLSAAAQKSVEDNPSAAQMPAALKDLRRLHALEKAPAKRRRRSELTAVVKRLHEQARREVLKNSNVIDFTAIYERRRKAARP